MSTLKKFLTLLLFACVIAALSPSSAAARGSRDSVDLENITLDAENDPPNMRMKIYARFKTPAKFSGDVDFAYSLSTERKPSRGEETFTYSFQKSSEKSVNFFSIDTKVPVVYIIRGRFKNGDSESAAMNFTYAIEGAGKSEAAADNASARTRLKSSNFESFWEETMADIKTIDLNESIELDPSRTTKSMKVYNVSYDSLDGARIYGYFFHPVTSEKGKKMPGIVFIHGYNMVLPGPFLDYCVNMEVAVLQIELRGNGRSAEKFRPATEYVLHGISSPEKYIYRGVIADCVCAARLIKKFDVVDRNRVVLNGGSQGAGLALITAALLGNSVAAVMADEPFMCNFKTGMEAAESGPYKKLRDYVAESPAVAGVVYDTLSYFDVMNFAEKIKAPVYISVGGRDTICPPATILPVISRIKAEKEVKNYPDAAHDLRAPVYLKERFDWLRKVLGRKDNKEE